MQLKKLILKNFRCFEDLTLEFDSNRILILGENGSGKSSIMEAIHYLCYLKSFRTSTPKDLIKFDSDNLFIKAEFDRIEPVQAGYAGTPSSKTVKISDKKIYKFKELMQHCSAITLTEEDLAIVSGQPEIRRKLIDQQVLLHNPQQIRLYSDYKRVLENRNALLKKKPISIESYCLWTDKLLEISTEIKDARIERIKAIQDEIVKLAKLNFAEFEINLKYQEKTEGLKNSKDLLHKKFDLHKREVDWGRTLIGCHLDDILIDFNGNPAKAFASRGQKKVITLLIKTAQITDLLTFNRPTIFLLDDFLTDLDNSRMEQAIKMLNQLDCQMVFSCPLENIEIKNRLIGSSGQLVNIPKSRSISA